MKCVSIEFNVYYQIIMTTMKKALAIMATLFISLTACADHEQTIVFSELPAQAQSFVQQHFNAADIAHIEKERELTSRLTLSRVKSNKI